MIVSKSPFFIGESKSPQPFETHISDEILQLVNIFLGLIGMSE